MASEPTVSIDSRKAEVVFVRRLKKTEVRFLVVAVRKKETEETIILICGSKKSKAESRITEPNTVR